MPDSIITPTQKDTIPLETAIKETTNWRNVVQPFMKDNVIRGFFIPIQDIIDLASFHAEAEAVRAYIMLTNPGDASSVKLAIVPVSKDGKDILSMDTEDGEVLSTIYDFTQPCPHLCDTTSKLY